MATRDQGLIGLAHHARYRQRRIACIGPRPYFAIHPLARRHATHHAPQVLSGLIDQRQPGLW
jgi:hypothetical protein